MLGYSDKPLQQLRYREFDGQSWSASKIIESTGIWSNQASVSHRGSVVLFGWNHADTDTSMRMFYRTRTSGTWSGTVEVDSAPVFKGYTTGLESVLPGESWQLAWSQDPTGSTSPSLVRCANIPP